MNAETSPPCLSISRTMVEFTGVCSGEVSKKTDKNLRKVTEDEPTNKLLITLGTSVIISSMSPPSLGTYEHTCSCHRIKLVEEHAFTVHSRQEKIS